MMECYIYQTTTKRKKLQFWAKWQLCEYFKLQYGLWVEREWTSDYYYYFYYYSEAYAESAKT